MTAKRKVLWFVTGAALAFVTYVAYIWGPIALDFIRAGFLEQDPKLRYSGTSMDNLKALHTAMMLYHESEGQFPHSDAWMEAVEDRIYIANMKKADARKKLVNPLLPPVPGQFGYAMNDAASAKYKDDVPEPSKTPLLFDSSDTSRNAHGDPKKLLPSPPRPGGNLGVSIEGAILKF